MAPNAEYASVHPALPVTESLDDLCRETTMGNAASSPEGTESGLSFELAFDILRHADSRDAAAAACTCTALHDLQQSQLWWRTACTRQGLTRPLFGST